MSCTTCGNDYVYGTDMHANCRKIEAAKAEQATDQEAVIADLVESVSNLMMAVDLLSDGLKDSLEIHKNLAARLDSLERMYNLHFHDLVRTLPKIVSSPLGNQPWMG